MEVNLKKEIYAKIITFVPIFAEYKLTVNKGIKIKMRIRIEFEIDFIVKGKIFFLSWTSFGKQENCRKLNF